MHFFCFVLIWGIIIAVRLFSVVISFKKFHKVLTREGPPKDWASFAVDQSNLSGNSIRIIWTPFCKVLAIFTSSSEEGTHNIKHFFHHSLLELYSERKRSNLSKDLLWAERKLHRTEDSILAFSKICCSEVSFNSKLKLFVDYIIFEEKNISDDTATNYLIVVSAIVLYCSKKVSSRCIIDSHLFQFLVCSAPTFSSLTLCVISK